MMIRKILLILFILIVGSYTYYGDNYSDDDDEFIAHDDYKEWELQINSKEYKQWVEASRKREELLIRQRKYDYKPIKTQ